MSKHHETPIGHCLGCVPIRTGVLAFSCFVLFLSFCAVAGLVTEDARILVGGYTYWSGNIVDIFGCLGVVFGLMSLVGVTDNHSQWVRLFAHFATVRTIVRLFVMLADYEVLQSCEKFGISSMSSHYNPAMETVVLSGRCNPTRPLYLFISIMDILISMYGVWNTYSWCYILDNGPMYHISIDDTKPLRIYTGFSTVGHPEAPPIMTVVPPSSPGPQGAYYDKQMNDNRLIPPGSAYGY